MQMKSIALFLAALFVLFFAPALRAANIIATGSGNWSSTVPDAPWPNGMVPGSNDAVDVESPFTVVVDTNVAIQYIYGSGTVKMGTNTTLLVLDTAGAYGTVGLGTLDASAPGNTVIYAGNPFWAKHQNYYNLMFSNTIVTNQISFWNGTVNSQDPAAAMTIAGNMTVVGKIKVQEGDDFTILGDLFLGTNSVWDCSSFNLTVAGHTTVEGQMEDLDGANGADVFNDMTIQSSGIWNLLDSTNYFVYGNLTNYGRLIGIAYASINFNGIGVITGNLITLPTLTFNGTNIIGTTITLFTNTPSLNGTLVFDIARTNQMILMSYPPANILTLDYGGALVVTNTGPAPMSGSTYQLFNASSFGGGFNSLTLPPLPPGLSWADNLYADGSISVTGTVILPPAITSLQYDPITRQFTLTWTSMPGALYSIQETSGLEALSWTTLASNIPSGGNSTTYTVTMPAGTAGFLRVYQQ